MTENILASPLQRGTWSGWSDARFIGSVPIDWIREPLLRFPDSSAALLANALMSFLDSFDRFRAHTPYDSDRVYGQALEWLGQSERPAFMWLHTMPPHAPYLPPPSTKYSLLPAGELDTWKDFMPQSTYYAADKQPMVDKIRLRYRELLIASDQSLGRFIDSLKAQGRFANAMIIFTSDHGESFERGFLGHAGTVTHEAVLRIPLLIKLPGQAAARVIDTPVSQADLVPTIAEALQLRPSRLQEGRSLMPALRGEALPQQPVFSMSLERQSRFQPLRVGHLAVVDGDHKAVMHLATGEAELYDLASDPGERRDLASSQPERLRVMRELIEAKVDAAEKRRTEQQAR
jgi:arylsulfatase A-like enzyme